MAGQYLNKHVCNLIQIYHVVQELWAFSLTDHDWLDRCSAKPRPWKMFLCMPVVRRMLTCCILVVTCWERSDFLALLYVMFFLHSQITHLTQDTIWKTFPYGVLGQVRYLIVWIPDLCLLHYLCLMYTYAKFDQNIPCGSRVTQWAFSLKEHDRPKWCSATHCHLFAYFSLIDHGRTDGRTYIDPRDV